MKTPQAALAILLLSSGWTVHAQHPPAKPAPRASDYDIRFHSRKLTPAAGVPADLAVRLKREIASQPQAQRAHVLVQLQAPADLEARRRLEKQGIVLLEPISKLAWYAATSPRGADMLARSNLVRWAQLIKPDDKITPAARPGALVGSHRMLPNSRVAYSVSFHRDVRPDEVLALAKRIGAEFKNFDADAFPVARAVRVSLPQGRLSDLAREDIVAWIEGSPPPAIAHNVLRAQPLSRVDRVQAPPFGLDGSGITVGIWDPGLVYTAHLDLSPRAAVQVGQTGQAGVTRDHATHLAGTIGASGQNVPNARGMAPNVSIASWDVLADEDVAGEVRSAIPSIQVSVHAWGPHIGWDTAGGPLGFGAPQTLFGQYTEDSKAFDEVVGKGLVVVKSAGNDRDDTANPPPNEPADCFQNGPGVAADCLDPIASAKNVITVGSVDSATAISTQSSFGPTDDGRIKPDLMAYGGSLGGPRTLSLGTASNVASAVRGGTSVSAAVVTGIVALVLQDANRRNTAVSPAAVKALLIQTAQDVQGTGQATVGPDFATGWGIANAEAAINLLRQGGIAEAEVSQTGVANAWKRNFFVPAGLAEVHLTLAWTDPPGNSSQVLWNDLDLRLIAPDGTQFTPWILNHASPGTAAMRNGGNDAINNVEQVSVLSPMAGVWTVQVSAADLRESPQKFAVAGLLPHSDIVLVMDRSGSMSLPSGTPGISKMQALQSAANELIDLLDLGGGHRLGLVQFQEDIVPFVPAFDLQPLAETNVGQAQAGVNSMTTGGWTNIISGVNAAAGQLGAASPPFPQQTIVLFSDGKHNRPVGSNLASISGTVQAGNFRFHSIGFGTDVDDAILSDVAGANQGIHVNEKDLSPLQLTKYFLTVGALAHDMSILLDPTYQLGSGESAKVTVNLSREDQSVTFAVNWTGQQAGDVQVSLSGTNPKCPIPLVDRGGLRTRAGARYRLIRIQLPFRCGGVAMHEGAWTITARVGAVADKGRETVDVMVLADSRLRLDAGMHSPQDAKHLLLTASLLYDGRPASKVGPPVVEAYVRMPRAPSNDSTKEDAVRKGAAFARPPVPSSEPRLVKVRLFDDGKNGDAKARDGVFTARVERASLPEGLLQARLVSRFQRHGLKLVREATTSAYVRH